MTRSCSRDRRASRNRSRMRLGQLFVQRDPTQKLCVRFDSIVAAVQRRRPPWRSSRAAAASSGRSGDIKAPNVAKAWNSASGIRLCDVDDALAGSGAGEAGRRVFLGIHARAAPSMASRSAPSASLRGIVLIQVMRKPNRPATPPSKNRNSSYGESDCMRVSLVIATGLLAVSALADTPPPTPPVTLHRLNGTITVDGDLSDSGWQDAAQSSTSSTRPRPATTSRPR